MWLNVLLVCATPFVVGAVILWIAERRRSAWGNDPLLRDLSFGEAAELLRRRPELREGDV